MLVEAMQSHFYFACFALQVPYEGVSRMTTSMKRKHRDRVVRRKIFEIEPTANAPLYTQIQLTHGLHLSIAGVSA